MPSRKQGAGLITIGVIAVLLLSHVLTGIAANHASFFKLEQRYISWNWLMSHYGIGDADPDVAFLVDNKILSQFDTQLFVDAEPMTHIHRPLVGGIVLENLMVLGTDNALLLLTRDGEFIERLGAEAGIPAPIQNIGVYHGEPVLQARNGMWRSNFMLDKWEPISLQGVSWSKPHPLPDSVATDLKQFFYGQGISVEQLLIDIHNGRVLGAFGVLLVDVLGLLLLALSFTGLWMWGKKFK